MAPHRVRRPALGGLLVALASWGCEDPVAPAPPESPSAFPISFNSESGLETRYGYPCYASTTPSQARANGTLSAQYTDWRRDFVTASGAPVGRRVSRRAFHNHDTVSEGIAWGMLLAAYMGDKPVFDDLWRYAQHYFLNRYSAGRAPLMHWHVNSTGGIVDGLGSATDADEDMALALIVANTRWGGYAGAASQMVNNVMAYDVSQSSFVLKPGDSWGGSAITNPSYFAPGFYRVFRSFTGDSRWDNVVNTSYSIIANVNARRGNSNGLLPDWTNSSGSPVSGYSYNYTYDATRVPWRLAHDAAWFCSDSRPRNQLSQLNGFFRGIGAPNIRDGYALSGATIGPYHNAAFVAPVASGSITSGDPAYQQSLWNEMANLLAAADDPGAYYGNTLVALSSLFASGNMPNPLDSRTPGRWVEDFEVNRGSNWWVFNDPASSVTKSALSAGGRDEIGWRLRVNYTIAAGGWGGVGTSFSPARNWSGYQAIDFWLRGSMSGSGPCYRLEIQENRNPAFPGQDTAERWEFLFNPGSPLYRASLWGNFNVPWSALRRRADWQPANAPNDGLTMSEVWGISIAPINSCTSGSFDVDRIELVPR